MFEKRILSLVMLIMLFALPVMASGEPMVNVDVENTSINLEWDVSELYDKLITVTVADNDDELSLDNLPSYAWVDVKPERTYTKSIKLSPTMESGHYYVYTDTESVHHFDSLYVMNINSDITKEMCDKAYEEKVIAGFIKFATLNAHHLGFDVSDEFVSDNFEDALSPLFYEMSRHLQKSPLAVYNSSRASIAYAALKNGYDADKIVAEYATELDADSADFSKITDKVKNKFTHYIANTDNSKESIADVIDQTLLLASLTGADDWSSMKECALENATEIGIDISSDSDYMQIPTNKQYKVFVQLYDSLGKTENFNDFADMFNSSVASVINKLSKDNTSSSSGGTSSNSGGTSSSKVVVSDSFLNQSTVQNLQPTPLKSFTDLEGHFSESYADELVALGVINGYEDNTFRPDNPVTRAEFVAMVQRAFLITDSGNAISFEDVKTDDWYFNAVSAASSNGIISGYNGFFTPNDSITRQDAAVVSENLMKYCNVETEEAQLVYSDTALIMQYAVSAVSKMTYAGVMQGYDGMFRPMDSITRGEAAAVVSRLIKLADKTVEVNN